MPCMSECLIKAPPAERRQTEVGPWSVHMQPSFAGSVLNHISKCDASNADYDGMIFGCTFHRSQWDESRHGVAQAMEGAMVGLQEAQMESMRRLTAGLTDAIGEAQLTLQVRQSLHPFRSAL